MVVDGKLRKNERTRRTHSSTVNSYDSYLSRTNTPLSYICRLRIPGRSLFSKMKIIPEVVHSAIHPFPSAKLSVLPYERIDSLYSYQFDRCLYSTKLVDATRPRETSKNNTFYPGSPVPLSR